MCRRRAASACRARELVLRHILPGAMPGVIVYVSLRIGNAILTAASLSFIGLGAQPPSPEWGAMLADGRSYLGVADRLTLFPGLAIFVTVLAFNLLGDGLRDALSPEAALIVQELRSVNAKTRVRGSPMTTYQSGISAQGSL